MTVQHVHGYSRQSEDDILQFLNTVVSSCISSYLEFSPQPLFFRIRFNLRCNITQLVCYFSVCFV